MNKIKLIYEIANIIAANVFIKYNKSPFITAEEIINLIELSGWKNPNIEKEKLIHKIILEEEKTRTI